MFWTSESIELGFEGSVGVKKARWWSVHLEKLGIVAKNLREETGARRKLLILIAKLEMARPG